MAQRLFDSAFHYLDTGVLVLVVAFELFQSIHGTDVSHAAARDDTLFHGCTSSCQSVVHTVFLLLHLDLGGSAHVQDCNAARKFGQTLLHLLAVVVRSRSLDLLANLCHAGFDCLLVAVAVHNRGVLLGDGYLLGASQHVERYLLHFKTLILGDYRTSGKDCDIFEHLLAAVAETGGLDGCDFKRTAQFVHDECGKSLAIHVLGDDYQRTALLCNRLQHAHDFLHGRNLLVGKQDIRLLHHGLHLLGVGHEVCRDISAVELHTLDYIHVGLGAFRFLDGYHTLLVHLAHSLGDKGADILVVVGRNGSHLLDFVDVAAHLAALSFQRLHDLGNGLVYTAFEVHRVGACRYVFQAHADDGLSQYGRSGGTVAGVVIGPRCDFLDHLRTHVGELVFELYLFGYRNTVLGDLRSTELLVYNDVAAFGTECDLDCIAERIDTLFEKFARLYVIFNLFCHNLCLLPNLTFR